MKKTVMQYRSVYAPLCIILILILSPGAVRAREGSPAAVKKHFLWSVETKRNTIYLLGSIHLLKKDSYPLPRVIESVYDCCPKLVFETDLDGMNSPEMQSLMIKSGLYPQGQTLTRHISRETYTLLDRKLKQSGLSVSRIDQFRPWFAAQAIASSELLRLGFEPGLGIDRYFFDRAVRDRKERIFLETNIYQMNLFAGLGTESQEKLLNQILKDLDVVEQKFSEIINAWESGDYEGLASIMSESFKEYPDLYRRLVTDRNRKWISKIQRLMRQDDDVLIVVGAAHLAGKDSVVELLRKKGYEVRQR